MARSESGRAAGAPSPAATSIVPPPVGAAFPTARPMFRPRSHFLHSFIKKQSGQKHPRDVALFGKTLGMFRGEECCAQPPTRHTLHPRTEINGTPEGGSMENHQMQLSASSSATDCDIRTGKDVRHNLLVIHMDASLPPSFSPPQYLNRGQACTLRLVF